MGTWAREGHAQKQGGRWVGGTVTCREGGVSQNSEPKARPAGVLPGPTGSTPDTEQALLTRLQTGTGGRVPGVRRPALATSQKAMPGPLWCIPWHSRVGMFLHTRQSSDVDWKCPRTWEGSLNLGTPPSRRPAASVKSREERGPQLLRPQKAVWLRQATQSLWSSPSESGPPSRPWEEDLSRSSAGGAAGRPGRAEGGSQGLSCHQVGL